MPIYEYQGKSYDIASDDPAEAKNKILKFLSSGEGESKPKSAQQAPVEGAGGAAFGVYRPQGRRPEANNDREAAKDMPLQTARGVVTGTLGAPSDILNLPGVLYSAVSGQPQPYQIPLGSEDWNQMLPGQSDAPSAKLARFGGEVMAPFPTVKGLQTIPKAAGAVGDVVSGAVGTGTGYIARPGRTPRGYQQSSQRNPIGNTFVEPEEFAKFERGELPYGQMPEQRPISELPKNALDRAALMMSGGNIPNAGQGFRAFGERLGETYRNPLTAAADIGSMFFTGGVPVLTALRGGLGGAQALADIRLANKGFTPELPKILNEYQTGVRPLPGVQPGPMPRGFQAAGPINPSGMATPAGQAAQATTQRVARPPAAPRAPAQPKQQWTLPDAGTHYAQAEQGSANFGDTFNKAVAQRTQDLLKDAKMRGEKLDPATAADNAYFDVKQWRSENVEAFKPKAEPELVGPVQPKPTADEVFAEFNKPKVDPELEMDQRIWKRLQDKDAANTPLEVNEETAVRRITNKYGPDPFGTGGLPNYTSMLPEIAETTPKQTRDTTKRNAKKELLKSFDDDSVDIDKALENYDAKIAKLQMDVYFDALKQAEGKVDPQSLANYALRQKNLPSFDGSTTQKRNAPSPSHKLETQIAEDWYDNLMKEAKADDLAAGDKNKQQQGFLKAELDKVGGDKAELMRRRSVGWDKTRQKLNTPKPESTQEVPGASLFEQPLEQAPTGKYQTMPETTPTIIGKDEIPAPSNNPMLAAIAERRLGLGMKTEPGTNPPKATPKPKKLNLADDKTDLTTKEIKAIFNSEGVSDIDSNMMNQVILEKHRMNFPSDWKEQLQSKSVKEIKEAANLYKEQKQGLDAFNSMFESKGYTTPTYWHISNILGNDLPIGDRALINVGKMSKEELSKRVDSYIEKNPNKVFKIEDLLKEPTADELAELAAIEKEIYGDTLAPTKKSKSKPKDAMEMMTGGKVFASKADFEEQALMDKLAGKITTGSFVDNGLRYEITEINYGTTPKDVLKQLNKPLTQVRVFSEKTGNQISGPVIEKSVKQRVEDIIRKRK